MKKLLSVCLVLIMMLSAFVVPASAVSTDDFYFIHLVDDVYYVLYEDIAFVIGFDFDEEDVSPKAGITIPETITHNDKNYVVAGVFDQAFYECDYTSVTLPSTIAYMGSAAFMSSPYLEEVVIPDDCEFEYFGDDVFLGTPFEEKLYSQDEKIIGKNVLFSYIGSAEEYVIPENINILVSKCFFMSGVKSVVFNDKVTEIPSFAFASCRNLKEVTIPDCVEYIYEGAFKDCTSLEKVTLGENVSKIEVDAFSNTKLKTIHLGLSVQNISGAFRDCKTLESITVESGHTLFVTDGDALYQKTKFVSKDGLILEYYLPSKAQGDITIKSGVYAIGEYAFYGCNGLGSVTAKDVEYVDAYAFANSSITSFDKNGEYYVFDYAFRNCKNLNSINLEKVNYIGVGAFENCTSLEAVTFSKDIYNIGELAFSNTGLKNVEIYGDDCYIYESAFKGCKELETVRLEDGVEYIGMNAFLDCPDLKTIYLSKTIIGIEDNAFNGCDNVTFELIKGTSAYKYIKNKTDFNFEVVGNYSFFQRIIDFFRSLFGLN